MGLTASCLSWKITGLIGGAFAVVILGGKDYLRFFASAAANRLAVHPFVRMKGRKFPAIALASPLTACLHMPKSRLLALSGGEC